MKLYYIPTLKSYATEKAINDLFIENGCYPGMLESEKTDMIDSGALIMEEIVFTWPKRGLSKKKCEQLVKEITSELVNRFKAGKDLFSNDKELIKKAFMLLLNSENVVEKRGYPFTMLDCKEFYGLHFTEKHSGKMSGMVSMSTACKANKFCKARMGLENYICFYCFAEEQLNNYGIDMLKPFLYNIWLLNRFQLSADILPLLNNRLFRLESFGDVLTIGHELNYIRFMNKNPKTVIAQWTKNHNIVSRALEIVGKPQNMIFIYSNPIIDRIMKLADIIKRFPMVDKVFNVVSEKYAQENNIKFTCGARHCLTCENCYTFGGFTEIIEKLRDAKSTKM